MALRIVKANEPIIIRQLNVCIYAAPGLGKTSLAFTADAPLNLDFDKGVYRACNRKDSAPIDKWADVADLNADDLSPYKTCVVDTAGRALDKLSLDIIEENPKMGRKDGSLSLQGFGVLKSRFASYMKRLNSFGKDVVLICHMDEQRNGDDVLERLDAQGSSKNEIYKTADAMGRILVRQGKRYLDFTPREGSFGKNPAQLPELEIPHPDKNPHFLAEVIASIKDTLNALTAEQVEAQRVIEEWITAIDGYKSPEEFTKVLAEIAHAPEAIKTYFKQAAKKSGFTYNGKLKAYEAEPVHA